MANKRISEMTELSAANIKADDLFLITDTAINALESKKVRATSLKTYVLDSGIITGSISYALSAASASYVSPTVLVNSSSYSLSSSYALSASYSTFSTTASYAITLSGSLPSSSYSSTSSYVSYMYGNGRIENSQTASYCLNAITASYLWYIPGLSTGTASYAISASNMSFNGTASYLSYTGIPNGTASFALNILNPEITASYIRLVSGRINGSASFSTTSSYAVSASCASQSLFLRYNGSYNGSASYAIRSYIADQASYSVYSSLNISSSYASSSLSSSYALTSSLCLGTSSYALRAGTINDTNYYKIYGVYSADAQTTSTAYVQNYIINSSTGTGKSTIVQAIGDIKVPLSVTETTPHVYLYVEYMEPSNTWSFELDKSTVTHYVSLTPTSGAYSISGYIKQGFSLGGSYNLSGSWYKFTVTTDGGVTLDARSVRFIIYSTADSITKTSYPPF